MDPLNQKLPVIYNLEEWGMGEKRKGLKRKRDEFERVSISHISSLPIDILRRILFYLPFSALRAFEQTCGAYYFGTVTEDAYRDFRQRNFYPLYKECEGILKFQKYNYLISKVLSQHSKKKSMLTNKGEQVQYALQNWKRLESFFTRFPICGSIIKADFFSWTSSSPVVRSSLIQESALMGGEGELVLHTIREIYEFKDAGLVTALIRELLEKNTLIASVAIKRLKGKLSDSELEEFALKAAQKGNYHSLKALAETWNIQDFVSRLQPQDDVRPHHWYQNDPIFWYELGLLVKDPTLKLQAFLVAIKSTPSPSVPLLYITAQLHHQLNQYQEADALCEQILKMTKERVSGRVFLLASQVKSSLQQYKEAESLIVKSISTAENRVPKGILFSAIHIKFALGENEQAEQYMDQFIQVYGEHLSVKDWASIAKLALSNKRWKRADQYYAKAISLGKLLPSQWFDAATTKAQLGEWETANTYFLKALAEFSKGTALTQSSAAMLPEFDVGSYFSYSYLEELFASQYTASSICQVDGIPPNFWQKGASIKMALGDWAVAEQYLKNEVAHLKSRQAPLANEIHQTLYEVWIKQKKWVAGLRYFDVHKPVVCFLDYVECFKQYVMEVERKCHGVVDEYWEAVSDTCGEILTFYKSNGIALDPSFLSIMAFVEQRYELFAKSCSYFSQLIEQMGDKTPVWVLAAAAVAFAKNKQIVEANDYCKKAIEMPDKQCEFLNVWSEIAKAKAALKQYQEADECFVRAYQELKGEVSLGILLQMANVKLNLGQFQNAHELYLRVIQDPFCHYDYVSDVYKDIAKVRYTLYGLKKDPLDHNITDHLRCIYNDMVELKIEDDIKQKKGKADVSFVWGDCEPIITEEESLLVDWRSIDAFCDSINYQELIEGNAYKIVLKAAFIKLILGQHEKAEQLYQILLKQDLHLPPTLYSRAISLKIKQKKWAEGLEIFDSWNAKMQPPVSFELGVWLHLQLGNREEAIKMLNNIVNVEIGQPDAWKKAKQHFLNGFINPTMITDNVVTEEMYSNLLEDKNVNSSAQLWFEAACVAHLLGNKEAEEGRFAVYLDKTVSLYKVASDATVSTI